MKRIITTISAALVSAFLLAPMLDAQGRGRNQYNNGGGIRNRTESPAQRPGNNGRPGNNNGQQSGQRPGDNRPDNRPEKRPGNITRPGQQPVINHGKPDNRPTNNHGFNNGGHQSHNPGYRPGNNYRPGNISRPPMRPPQRPYMPANRPWRPPVRPAHFHPGHGAPTFTGVLGVLFGTALDITLNNLLYNGYNVTGYGPNTVYLNNVGIMDFSWPEATLNYVNGVLRGSEFTYSTGYYDMSRYNMLYRSLTNSYGLPVSVNGTTVTWWGYNNGYVRLSYFNDYAYNGSSRYYTTLSIGN